MEMSLQGKSKNIINILFYSKESKLNNTFIILKLSLLVSSEFFNEGDLEKEKFKKEPIVNFKYHLKFFKFYFSYYK